MRCLNCNQVVEGKFDYCPICGCKYENNPQEYTGNYPVIKEDDEREKLLEVIKDSHEDEVELEDLPGLKIEDTVEIPVFDTNLSDNEEDIDYKGVELSGEYDNKEIDDKEYEEEIEKTRTINPFLDSDLSFTSEINKQIEDFNNTEGNNIEELEDDIKDNNDFSSSRSVNERKNTLVVAFVCMLLIIGVCVFALFKLEANRGNDTKEVYNVDDVEKLYEEFINSNNSDDLKKLLKDNKDTNSGMENIHREMNRVINKSIDDLTSNEYKSLNEFNNDLTKYRNAFSTIYSITEDNQGTVRLITIDDYKDITNRLNNLGDDAKGYFEALNYYNDKSYNESYYMFSKVDKDSKYYDRSYKYLDKIMDDVIVLIKTDITKMESGIEELNDDDKLTRYSQIEDVIIAYDSIYENLKLSSNSDYNELLNTYKNKVNEYSN